MMEARCKAAVLPTVSWCSPQRNNAAKAGTRGVVTQLMIRQKAFKAAILSTSKSDCLQLFSAQCGSLVYPQRIHV